MYDVVIVGAGPAGLSAALILGRCRRKTLICNTPNPRNWASRSLHGFLSRDGCSPSELLKISLEQLKAYPDVEYREVEMTDITRTQGHFEVTLKGGEKFSTRRILLATGILDEIPQIDGILDFFGKTVFLCPYCDGWETRDQPIAVYGKGSRGPGFALTLTRWSPNIVLCSDGPLEASPEEKKKLEQNKIRVIEKPIARLEGREQKLEKILFTDGDSLERKILFFNTPISQHCTLAQKIGCELTDRGEVKVDASGQSCIPGVYIAGDASPDLKLAIIAAAEGAKAAFAINSELLKEDLA